jgi:hypothetical protein
VAKRWQKYLDNNPIRRDLDELADLAKRYVKEETIEPVKDLGRYAAFGCAGSLFVGLGTLFLLVGALRLLQEETGTFHGTMSWVPYLIVIVAGLSVMGVVAWRIVSGPAKRRSAKEKGAS